MILDWENINTFNLGDLEVIPGLGKNGLVRVPAEVRNKLNERARFVGMDSAGIEIRFVTDAPNIDIYLSAQKPESNNRGIVRIYKGNFLFQTLELEPGQIHFFRLTPPPAFKDANDKMLNNKGFSKNVWRIVCDRTTVIFHGINTHGHSLRPPEKNELPKFNWLAYGSSITNSNLDGYPQIAAQILGVQVQNMGFNGACQIEKEIVDYMIDKRDFDFITCELGVNMRGAFTPEVFEQRTRYLIDRLIEIKKPALFISVFPNSQTDEYTNNANIVTEHEVSYNQILSELVQKANMPNIGFMNGYEVLTDINGLSGDLIHPTAYGHAIMGMNLANRLKNFIL